jgi:hypothetical protein
VIEWKVNPLTIRNAIRESGRAEAIRDENSTSELDRRLDQALEETFPASDPIAIVVAS